MFCVSLLHLVSSFSLNLAFCPFLAFCVFWKLKRAKKPQFSTAFSLFCFSIFTFVLCVLWRGIKSSAELVKREEPPPPKLRAWGDIYRLSLAIFLTIYRGIYPVHQKKQDSIDLNSSFSILRENAAWCFVWAWHWPWHWFFSWGKNTVAFSVAF